MEYNKIVVAGAGVLGSQIAFQSAYCGFNVTIIAQESEIETSLKPKLEKLKQSYLETIEDMKQNKLWALGISDVDSFNEEECIKKVENAINKITIETDKAKALENSDLVIESIVEDMKIKLEFYKSIQNLLPSKTVVVTNSSTLLPSKLVKPFNDKTKFLALHFANSIWKNNIAEVMKQDKTSDESFNYVLEFAKRINMISLPIYKEKSGYLLNSMLVPLLFSALDLYANEISDVESIDKTWKIGTGAPRGPFEIIDVIGLTTCYNVVKMYLKIPSFLAPYNFKKMAKVLEKYISEGKLGRSTKEGFYKYE